jgi:hypothetical protein
MQQGDYHIDELPIGCYKLEIIARYPGDVEHSNDTANIEFSVFAHTDVKNVAPIELGLRLDQNFPNPFTASTTIPYSVPENGRITFRIFDITGRVIQTEMMNAPIQAGAHQINFNLHNLLNGIYMYELTFTNEKGEAIRRSETMTMMK